MLSILNKYVLGDIAAIYLNNNEHIEMILVPASMGELVKLNDIANADSLVQVKIEGDAMPNGFAAGHTDRNCASVENLIYAGQKTVTDNDTVCIVTEFNNAYGLEIKHITSYKKGDAGVTIRTEATNKGDENITLEMLSSFSFSYLTPFEEGEATNQLKYYRLRSKWSNEGRVESGTIEDLQLEPTWARHGVNVEKFGQIGSMPVRKFFPFIAIEDVKNGVVWASELCVPSSWQIEMYRKSEKLCVSGGLADYDFGHWKKLLKKGETFSTPASIHTVVKGDFDEACRTLVNMQETSEVLADKKLPSVFNEYCTTWGDPSEENILKIIDVIKDRDFDYFVIDAGWYADENGYWQNNMGDWVVNRSKFPHGLEYVVDAIHKANMKAGIWFELETVGKDAKALCERDHLLKKNGKIIQAGDRFFWDMRDEWTINYLTEKVIGLLNKYNFEYIKIDYNETIGIGCDGSDSLGQGLYENVLATQKFFDRIHEQVDGIVIELCSSGGHRLEPSFLNCTDMASFSDAHEEVEIPIIAANLHRIMKPEKSQIWSVIRKTDSLKRIGYSVSCTFLGVLCISGEVYDLDSNQWKLIDDGIRFYRAISHLIKNGKSYIFGTKQISYRKLQNYQAVLRKNDELGEAYILIQSYEKNQSISINLGEEYQIVDRYEALSHDITIDGNVLNVFMPEDYDSIALYLRL